MNKKELISIANMIGNDSRFTDFYEFSKTYLQNPSIPDEEKISSFFDMVIIAKNNPNDRAIQNILGKRSSRESAAASYAIKEWCKTLLENQDLKKLSLADLHYVMACSARLAKIKAENI